MAEAVRERESECPVCPPWVVACVHLDGLAVRMTDGTLVAGLPMHASPKRFGVHGPAVLIECNCGVKHTVFDDIGYAATLDDFAAARTEFLRRAELLRLGGGVSSVEKRAAG